MKQYAYTYKVKEVNIQEGHIVVEYTPNDTTLTAYSYNIPTYIRKEDGTLKSIEEVIIEYAPHALWESQELLKTENPLNLTGTVN